MRLRTLVRALRNADFPLKNARFLLNKTPDFDVKIS